VSIRDGLPQASSCVPTCRVKGFHSSPIFKDPQLAAHVLDFASCILQLASTAIKPKPYTPDTICPEFEKPYNHITGTMTLSARGI
jgi:hypothetical protein